jgi:hypothetical protein
MCNVSSLWIAVPRLHAVNCPEEWETMIKIVPGPDGAHWSLVSCTSVGADVLAHAGTGTDRHHCTHWQQAVERLRDAAGTLSVRDTADGHFQWALVGADEETIAESPPVYRDAESCRRSFAAARRAAREAVGNGTLMGHDPCAP